MIRTAAIGRSMRDPLFAGRVEATRAFLYEHGECPSVEAIAVIVYGHDMAMAHDRSGGPPIPIRCVPPVPLGEVN